MELPSNYDLYSRTGGTLGSITLKRNNQSSIPPVYRGSAVLKATANAAGTNNNITQKVTIPDVLLVDGSYTAPNKAVVTVSITALQNVSSDVVTQALTDTISLLTAYKASYINGGLPAA